MMALVGSTSFKCLYNASKPIFHFRYIPILRSRKSGGPTKEGVGKFLKIK